MRGFMYDKFLVPFRREKREGNLSAQNSFIQTLTFLGSGKGKEDPLFFSSTGPGNPSAEIPVEVAGEPGTSVRGSGHDEGIDEAPGRPETPNESEGSGGNLRVPFVSGISGGDASDLSFSIQTAWIPGLSLKFSYRPNDSYNPFVFAVKSGITLPNSLEKSSVLAMGAEFSLLRRGNPCFMLQIKPEIGDFSLRRSVVSPSGGNRRVKFGASGDELPVENRGENGMVDIPVERLLNFKDSPGHSAAAARMQDFISETAIMARTRLPLTKNGFLKIRWGVNFPPDLHAASSSFRHSFTGMKLPFLTVNKISVETVESAAGVPPRDFLEKERGSSEVALSKGMLGMMKEDMEALRRENDLVRESIRDLKSVMEKQNGGNLLGTELSDADDKAKKKRNGAGERKLPEYSGRSGSSPADVSGELKKAIEVHLVLKKM